MTSIKTPSMVTVAGSDCSGGAGIEADLKTFTAHAVYGMVVTTCVVAENPRKVTSIHPIPASVVRDQIRCCFDGMKSMPLKTGMLYSSEIIRAVHREITGLGKQVSHLIVDPVMVSTSGRRLLQKDAIHALKKMILQEADLVTPNLDEAEILAGQKIQTLSQMEKAAMEISRRFDCAVLLKGGHLKDSHWASDFFWDGRTGKWFRSARIQGIQTHGTGCTYSAAITANLAKGYSLIQSINLSKRFMTRAIRQSLKIGPWTVLNHGV